jgi:hypothetical protein
MVLQSSGAISLNDIQTEFGGTNPIGINEYYDAADGVPASGEISFDDFYGKSNYMLTSAYQSQLATWGFTPDSLIYKSSRDGLSNSAFHNNCDSLGNSIVVIKTVNGYIFGGIATNSWSGSGYKTSTTAFLFNLYGNASAPIKWDITDTRYNIYANPSHGVTFGAGHDLYIRLDDNYMYENNSSYGGGGGYTGRMTGYTNAGYNRIVEVEVWSVSFTPLLTSAYQSQLATWGFTPGTLIYKSARDGFSNLAFHSRCDTLSRSIVVIKAANGYIFGGIAGSDWTGSGMYKTSTNTFLFNLYGNASAPIKWDINTTTSSMYAHHNYGPTFGGGHDLHTNLDTNYMYEYNYSYGSRSGYTGRLTGYTNSGSNRIVEVEVWSY